MSKNYADQGVMGRSEFDMRTFAIELVQLQRELLRAIELDDRRRKENDHLREELAELSDRAGKEIGTINRLMYAVISRLPGRRIDIPREELTEEAQYAQIAVAFNPPDSHYTSLIAFDADTYKPGDVDFSNLDATTVHELLRFQHPKAQQLFSAFAEWWQGQQPKGANEPFRPATEEELASVKPITDALEAAGLKVETVVRDASGNRTRDIVRGTADEAAGIGFRDVDLKPIEDVGEGRDADFKAKAEAEVRRKIAEFEAAKLAKPDPKPIVGNGDDLGE